MSVADDSRYARVIVLQEINSGEIYFSTRLPVKLQPAADDRWILPRPEEWWDAIADRVWRASFGERAALMYWLLCDLNGIVNPFRPIDTTKRLRVPSAECVVLKVFT